MTTIRSIIVGAGVLTFSLAHGASAETLLGDSAHADLKSLSGSSVTGTADFHGKGDGVEITLKLSGLTPGEHGFHIHEVGDCNAMDGSSAGPHFNPLGKHHGGPGAADRHAGDLGNITADATGKVDTKITDPSLKLSGVNAIVGKSVIVHEKADDLKTDPSGSSGKRIACGVIE